MSISNSPVRMLTINEAAKLIDGLTAHRIRAMCLDGSLPYIRAGKKYLICESVLLNVLCGNTQTINNNAACFDSRQIHPVER